MVLAIEVLLAAGILLAVALAAVGRLDGMSREIPDAPAGLPDDDVTPAALRQVRFPVVLRGYRMRDVDEALERAALELESLRAELGERDVPAITASTRPVPYERSGYADADPASAE
jgi:DivIVA domain-containing protein